MRELPLLARELWKSLWVEEADDHGRCEAWAQALHGRLFSGSPDVDAAQVEEALQALVRAGLLRRYEVRGEAYVVFTAGDWLTQGIDKPSEPLYPCPACHRTECHVEGCTCKRCAEHKDETGCRCRKCRPCTPTEPPQAEGARRGERRAERRETGDEGQGAPAHRGSPAGDAGDAVPPHRGGDGGRRVPADGGVPDAGGGAAEPGGELRGDGRARAGSGEPGAEHPGQTGVDDEAAGPEEPAQGTVAQDEELERPRPVMGRADAGSSPVGSTIPAPQALALFAEAAGDRWAPGKPHLTTTGLPHVQEAAWQRVWAEARGAGYGAEDVRALGLAVRKGRVWKSGPLSPGKLIAHLLDLLAEAAAPAHERGPPWRRENPFDHITEELEREERDVVAVECKVES